jgi:hypothetical protein
MGFSLYLLSAAIMLSSIAIYVYLFNDSTRYGSLRDRASSSNTTDLLVLLSGIVLTTLFAVVITNHVTAPPTRLRAQSYRRYPVLEALESIRKEREQEREQERERELEAQIEATLKGLSKKRRV